MMITIIITILIVVVATVVAVVGVVIPLIIVAGLLAVILSAKICRQNVLHFYRKIPFNVKQSPIRGITKAPL